MKFFGYTDEEITKVFNTLTDNQQEESSAFTGLQHVCPASYEFGLALNRSTLGSTVASPSTRFYVWKATNPEELEVPRSFLFFQREFAASLTMELLDPFNSLAMRMAQEQAVSAVKRAKRGLGDTHHPLSAMAITATTTTGAATTAAATTSDTDDEDEHTARKRSRVSSPDDS